MANHPASPTKTPSEFDHFTNFVRRVVSVPHSEIKAKLEAEKAAKRTSKRSASRVPASSSKGR
jgi:hypothetical protein